MASQNPGVEGLNLGDASRKMSPLKIAWAAPPSPCTVKKMALAEVGGQREEEELHWDEES